MRSAWWDGDWPVTQPYGCTDYEEEGVNPNHPECPFFHEGLDLGLNRGTVVRAVGRLYCLQVGAEGYGPYAVVLTDGAWDFWLGHGYSALVQPGDWAYDGQAVMLSNSLGYSTGDHLHFEVRPRGGAYRSAVDPGAWLVAASPLPAGPSPPSPLPEESPLSQQDLDRIWGALNAHDAAIRQLQGMIEGVQSWGNSHDAAIRQLQAASEALQAEVADLAPGRSLVAVEAALTAAGQELEAAAAAMAAMPAKTTPLP